MMSVQNMLLISTSISAVILLLLLFLSMNKHPKTKQRKVMSSEMRKIKEEIAEE